MKNQKFIWYINLGKGILEEKKEEFLRLQMSSQTKLVSIWWLYS